MYRKLFVFIAILCSLSCHSQEFNTWYFGSGAGLTFNPGGNTTPHAVTDGKSPAYEGNASISDSNGNILFYTNGTDIYGRSHQVILNGSGLLGHQSTAQSSLIVPLPNSDNIYYVFTADASENNFANGYRYSIVDVNGDAGKGSVTVKNVLLNASCSERLTAARHSNGIDVWVIGNERNSNVFKAWLLTCNGLETSPVVSTSGVILNNQDLGMMKLSPNGKYLCQTNYPDVPGNFFQLFDFDDASGVVSNPRTITNDATSYFACEFSSDSRLLYVTRAFEKFIDQFVLSNAESDIINASREIIPADFGFYGIQLGPDEKIYLNRYKTKLSVINQPNTKGAGCGFVLDQVDLGGRSGVLGLPNPVSDAPVDPYNNFSFAVTDSCSGMVQFSAYSVLTGTVQWSWDFGDGSTSLVKNPLHQFARLDQLYKVKLVITSPDACGKIRRVKYLAAGGASAQVDFDFVAKCDSGYVRFINKSSTYPVIPVSYNWDFGDGTISTDQNPVHVYAGSGTFAVTLSISTGLACLDHSVTKSLDLQQLDIHVIPVASQIDVGQTVQLGITGGGTHFQWTPPQWLSDAGIANPVASPLEDVTYKVIVRNDAGCVDEDSVTIKLNAPNGIFVPSAFSPNGDGKNELFKPYLGPKFTLMNFSIFNRWGQQIFTTQKNEGWNGSVNGLAQNNGIYIWVLQVKDETGAIINRKGTVALIR